MTTIYQIYLAIAFFVLLSPIAFYLFTRLENPVESTYGSGAWRVFGSLLFILSLPLYFGICAFISSYFYLQSYPEMSVLGMDGAEWGGYMQGSAPDYFGVIVVTLILLLTFGSIWALPVASRRWEAKVWEDPGNLTSRALRAIAYFMHVYFASLVLIVGLAILFYFFREQFLSNLAAIPYWFRQMIAGRVNDELQSSLIGFAVVVGIDLLVVLWALVGLIRALMSRFWPKVEATIAHSELYTYITRSSRSSSINYRFRVEFSYLVDGVMYASNRLTYNMQWINQNKPYILGQTKRYPVGAVVEAYVNPKNPNVAVLEAGVDWFGLFRLALHAAFFFVLATTFLIPEAIR